MTRVDAQMRMMLPITELERLLLEEFTTLDASASPVALTFGAMEDGAPRLFRVELGPSAAVALREIAARLLAELERRVYDHGLRIHPYSPSTRLDAHELEYMDLSEQPSVLDQITPLETPKQLDPLQDQDVVGPYLKHYVVSLRTPRGTWLHCSRLMTLGSQPLRSKLAIVKGHGEGYFDSVSRPMYLLDPENIDCVWHGRHLFILDKERFERTFQLELEADARETARTLVQRVARNLPFTNADDFVAACQRDRRMAAKIAKMKGQAHLELLSVQRAKEAKARFGLGIEFERGPDGREALRFVPRFKWQYVSILGDEYLTSPMTDLDYESNSKRLVRASSGLDASPERQTPTPASEAAGELIPALVGTRPGR
jgi:hypothetical protein